MEDPNVFQIVPLGHAELVARPEVRNGRGRAPGRAESPEDRIPIYIARVNLNLPTAGADCTERDTSHRLARFEVAFEKLRSGQMDVIVIPADQLTCKPSAVVVAILLQTQIRGLEEDRNLLLVIGEVRHRRQVRGRVSTR